MNTENFDGQDENIRSHVEPNIASFANGATHKSRHSSNPDLFRGVDATIVLDLTKEAEQMAADRGRVVNLAYVYVIEAAGLRLFKIGRANDMRNRLPSYRTECPVPCRAVLVAAVPITDVGTIELALHDHYRERRTKGEWFALTEEDLAALPKIIKQKATYPIAKVKRDLWQYPVATAEFVNRQRRLEIEIEEMRARNARPLSEYVIDRLAHAKEGGVLLTAKCLACDLRDSLGRKPQDTHDAIRSMLQTGEIAMLSPLRHPETGEIWFDEYRRCDLVQADGTCRWETTACGREVLVSVTSDSSESEIFGLPASRPPKR